MAEVKKKQTIREIEWHDLHHTNTINFRFIADTECLGLLPQLEACPRLTQTHSTRVWLTRLHP